MSAIVTGEAARRPCGHRNVRRDVDCRAMQTDRFDVRGKTLIRHAPPPGTVAAVSFSVRGTPIRCRLVAPTGRPLRFATGLLCAGSSAVNLTPIAPSTDKRLTAAASAQEHSTGRLIVACVSACEPPQTPALWVC